MSTAHCCRNWFMKACYKEDNSGYTLVPLTGKIRRHLRVVAAFSPPLLSLGWRPEVSCSNAFINQLVGGNEKFRTAILALLPIGII